jgi:hypothetical protein
MLIPMERKNFYGSENAAEEPIDIEDIEEAREFIRERMEKNGDLPMVTVPAEYIDEARKGIKPHTTWIYDSLIAGTLSRDPYLPDDSPRVAFRVKTSPDEVVPRFTGPDKHFHGVVVFKRPIPPSLLEEFSA